MHEFRRVCRAFGGPVGVFLFIYLFGGGGMGGLPLPLSREHFGSFGDWQVADVAKQGVLISRGQRLLRAAHEEVFQEVTGRSTGGCTA